MLAVSQSTESPASQLQAAGAPRTCQYSDLGHIEYGAAWDIQRALVAERKHGSREDHLLFAEHPHVITFGRTSKQEHLLASPAFLEQRGIAVWESDRGGDITYHGPGQLIGYPIFDLREWKRDVVAYLRGLEQALIESLTEFGIESDRLPGCTGVWVDGAKVAAMGVHCSRWVTSHGFALNITTDLSYFGHIVPCGLTKPVTSMEKLLGEAPPRDAVRDSITRNFGRIFGREMNWMPRPSTGLDSSVTAASREAS